MFPKLNFHTHTKYCDGKNTTAEMVERAVALGFSALGFSGHAYTPPEPEYSMSHEVHIGIILTQMEILLEFIKMAE